MKNVVICGSVRFKDDIYNFAARLKKTRGLYCFNTQL